MICLHHQQILSCHNYHIHCHHSVIINVIIKEIIVSTVYIFVQFSPPTVIFLLVAAPLIVNKTIIKWDNTTIFIFTIFFTIIAIIITICINLLQYNYLQSLQKTSVIWVFLPATIIYFSLF